MLVWIKALLTLPLSVQLLVVTFTLIGTHDDKYTCIVVKMIMWAFSGLICGLIRG